MINHEDITIYGGQQSAYNLYHLGEFDDFRKYYYDLGDAAKFATYDEVTNTLKVQNVTLEDAGDYRLIF